MYPGTGGPGSPYILAGCSPVCESMHDGATGHYAYIGPEGYAVVNEKNHRHHVKAKAPFAAVMFDWPPLVCVPPAG